MSSRCSSPRTFRKVSCWPAKDASGRSSAVAEERTATANSALAAPILRQASSTSSLQPLGKRRGQHPAADLLADRRQPLDIVDVERREHVANAPVEAALRQKIAIGMRGGRESAGNRDAEARQARDHFADRRVLAADEFDVLVLQLFKGNDVWFHD